MDSRVLFFIIATLVVSGALGISLLRRGLRGRRVGDHPVCGKCGFDLFGLPKDQAKCPECGNDLSSPRAVQTGHRVRRMPLVYAGSALLLLFALVAGTEGPDVFRQINWQQMKPASWLVREARKGSAAAWTELGRRARLNELPDDRAVQLITDALAWQKDATRTWLPAVGDFVEEARAGGDVTDEQWATYCRQAPRFTLTWRPKVRKGDPLPGRIMTGAARVGSSGKLSVRTESPVECHDPLVAQPRGKGGVGHHQHSMNPTGGGGSSGVYLRLDPKAVEAAPLGKRTTTVKMKTEVRESWDAPGVVAWVEELSADWELVSADAQTVELIPDNDPELRKQIETGLRVVRLEAQPHPKNPANRTLSLNLKIGTPPMPLAFDVFLRSGAREWKLTTISMYGATEYMTGGYLPATANFHARRVDVVLRPSVATAHHSTEITRIWNGEVIVPDVEVKWPDVERPTTRP